MSEPVVSMPMSDLLWVALGGAAGAVTRHLVNAHWGRSDGGFPWATLWVNVAGCLLLGALAGLAESGWVAPRARLALGTGALGALTTFSTFGWETIDLLRRQQIGLAALNVVAQLALGLAAAAVGYALVRFAIR